MPYSVTDSFALYIGSEFLEVVPNRETSHASEIGCINERSRITPKFRRLATPEDGPSATAPKAYAPAATAAAQTARATAAAVTENLVTARGLCAGTVYLSKIRGCAVPAHHLNNLAKHQNERGGIGPDLL